ncbi:MAG: hypothetical protein ICV64_00520 [Thermoleophilia bacterium]|nr:hypothetical protein [Thermoleophilia bacterium]
MAGRKKKITEARRCTAALADGTGCRGPAEPDSIFCSYHVLHPDPPARAPVAADPPSQTRPTKNPRDLLGRWAVEDVELMRKSLRACLAETTTQYASCPGCGKRQPFQVPAAAGRAKAVEVYLSQGWGRLAEEQTRKEQEGGDLQRLLDQVETMVNAAVGTLVAAGLPVAREDLTTALRAALGPAAEGAGTSRALRAHARGTPAIDEVARHDRPAGR